MVCNCEGKWGCTFYLPVDKNGPSESGFGKNVREMGTLVYFYFLGSSWENRSQALKINTLPLNPAISLPRIYATKILQKYINPQCWGGPGDH